MPPEALAPSAPARSAQPLSRRQQALVLHAGLAGIALVVLGYLFKPQRLAYVDALLAMSVVYLGTLPMALHLSRRSWPSLPLLPMVGMFYAISFGLVMFSDAVLSSGPNGWNATSWHTALLLTSASLCCLLAAFFTVRRAFSRYVRPIRLPRPADTDQRLRRLAWLLLIPHTLAVAGNWNDRVPVIGNLLVTGLGFMCFTLFFELWTRGRLTRGEKWLLLAAFLPAIVLFRFSSGFLWQVILLLLQFALLYWHTYKKVPWKLTLIGTAFFLLFQPIKEEYRYATWDLDKYQSSMGIAERIGLLGDLAVQAYSLQGGSASGPIIDTSGGKTASRLANIVFFSYVIHATPKYVPYWNGETYLPIFTKLIPRFLWRNKPEERTGNASGHRYSQIHPTDDSTSLNLNTMVEGYANFGPLGSLLIMTIAGAILGMLDHLLNSPGARSAEKALTFASLLGLCIPESNFSILYGGLIYAIPLYYLTLRLALSLQWRGRNVP